MDIVPRALLEETAQRFKLLSETVRLELLNHLHVTGEMPVQDLVDATGHNQANVSKHLLLMARSGILNRRQEGLHVYYSIKDPTLQSLCLLVCSRLQQEVATGE